MSKHDHNFIEGVNCPRCQVANHVFVGKPRIEGKLKTVSARCDHCMLRFLISISREGDKIKWTHK